MSHIIDDINLIIIISLDNVCVIFNNPFPLAGSFHLGLYERITGRTLDISKCNVEWNCPDWIEVGKSAVATVQVI